MNIALLAFFKYATGVLAGEPGSDSCNSSCGQSAFPSGPCRPSVTFLTSIKEEELDPSLLEFCLYMSFWPTVLTGPISRLPSLLPQFRQRIGPSPDDFCGCEPRVAGSLHEDGSGRDTWGRLEPRGRCQCRV